MEDRRKLFDNIALNCITYLENFKECQNINFTCNNGVITTLHSTHNDFINWEQKNSPYKLPKDLKDFYSVFNGFNLNWNTELHEKLVTIGIIIFIVRIRNN